MTDTQSVLVLKLATWNINRAVNPASRRGVRILNWMSAVAPDVWVLTETDESITPGAGYLCASTASRGVPAAPGEHWVTIWSRFPLEPLAVTSDPRHAVAARVTPPAGAPFLVYGTVLPWLGIQWSDGAGDGVREDFDAALKAQAADWAALQAKYPDDALFVAGDFNQDLVTKTHYYGSRERRDQLQTALADAKLVALTAGEHDPVRRDSPPCASVDHICISEGSHWRQDALSRWPDMPRPDGRLSDHFGLAVECSFSAA